MSKETQYELLAAAKVLLAWVSTEAETAQSEYLKKQYASFCEVVKKANTEFLATIQ